MEVMAITFIKITLIMIEKKMKREAIKIPPYMNNCFPFQPVLPAPSPAVICSICSSVQEQPVPTADAPWFNSARDDFLHRPFDAGPRVFLHI